MKASVSPHFAAPASEVFLAEDVDHLLHDILRKLGVLRIGIGHRCPEKALISNRLSCWLTTLMFLPSARDSRLPSAWRRSPCRPAASRARPSRG